MTDGILLQELKSDPYLSKYSVIMVDEAHERSLNIDFILGLLKQIIAHRSDLKVIISSATINTSVFSSFFDGAKIISIDARIYPIDIIYRPLVRDEQASSRYRRSPYRDEESQLDKAIVEIVSDQALNHKGDVLVFLPGEADIKSAETALRRRAELAPLLEVYPLYGRLSKEEQERVFTPTGEGKTKVVISTNIAETSITIDGITCVIDSGEAKINFYNQKDFTSSLVPMPISKSSAFQRAGRAGRTQKGTCYRLYSEQSLAHRSEFTQEEILRSDLAEVALRMSDLGIFDYDAFPFITSPKKGALLSAEHTLQFIGAIDKERHLTDIGSKMVLFPLLPRHSRVIVEAILRYPNVLTNVVRAVAFLSTKNPFLLPKDKEEIARAKQSIFQDSTYGDFVGYLKLYSMYASESEKGLKAQEKFCKTYYLDIQTMNEVIHISEQLDEIVSHMGVPLGSDNNIGDYLTCLAAGLLQFVCVKDDQYSYHSLTAEQIFIHPGSSWFKTLPKFILAGEIVMTSRMFARTVSPLQGEYLDRIDPDLKYRLLYGKSKKEYIEKEEQRRQSKEQKEQLKKSLVGGCELFGRKYPYTSKGSEVVIPVKDLPYLIDKAFEKGSVRKIGVRLEIDGMRSHKGNTLKALIQEGSLIKMPKGKLSLRKRRTTYNLIAHADMLPNVIDQIFTLSRDSSNCIVFVGFTGSGDNYALKGYPTLLGAIDATYFSLSNLRKMLKDKKNSKLRSKVDHLLSLIEETEDFGF